MGPITSESSLHLNSNLELLAKLVVEGFITGLHKSPFHGFSVEFAEHTAYNSGDNVRNIDWKLYAKTDKLYIKRYEEETNLRCQFIIDTSSSMYFPAESHNKVNFSVQAVASLMYLLRRQRDAFGLSLFTEQLWLNTPARSTNLHQKYLLTQLEGILGPQKKSTATNLALSLHQVAESVHKRSLIIIFSDLLANLQTTEQDEGLFAALQHLKFNKHEIIIFSVSDKKKEVDFLYDHRPYEFIDMETGAVLKTNSAMVRENYISSYNQYRNKIALKCAQYNIDLVEADIDQGFNAILSAYLIKRQKMT
jgi:uncharacterized protein (DUF58 family)